MKFRRTTKVLSDLGMSSMTDLVFLLLIFFLITSTLVNPNALKLLLPKSTGQVSAKATVSVSIKDWGEDVYSYHINGQEAPVAFTDVEDDSPMWKTNSSACCRPKKTRPSPFTPMKAYPSRKWSRS